MMSPLSLLLVLATPIFCFLVHCVVLRIRALKEKSRWMVAGLAIASGIGIAVCGACYFSPPFSLSAFLFYLCVSVSLGHVYFHVFNMSETARRIRILIHIGRGESPYDESAEHLFVPQRLTRLELAGCIRQEKGVYFLIPNFRTRLFLIVRAYEKLLFDRQR